MWKRVPAALLVLALSLPTAVAQTPWASFSQSWFEVDAVTLSPIASPNGVLEPGEAARLVVSVAFTPVGTVVFPPNTTIAGFAEAGLVFGTATPGFWSDHQFAPGFSGQSIIPSTSLVYFISQPDPPLGSFPVATNPIPALWSIAWIPTQYSPQAAVFHLGDIDDLYPALFIRVGTNSQGQPLFNRVAPNYSMGTPMTIPIAPAPPVVAAAVAGLVAGQRRRRSAQWSLMTVGASTTDCNSASTATLIEVLSVVDSADIAMVCESFACHSIVPPCECGMCP